MSGKIFLTVIGIRRRHGQAEGRPDPKEAALAAARCLNPHPEQVSDPEFLASEFFDARDVVQVKYEMVRKVKAAAPRSPRPPRRSGTPGRRTTRRPPRWSAPGWRGWSRPGPGRAAPTSSPRRSCAWAEEQLAADPGAAPGAAGRPIEESFGVRVHPRSVERALARRRERHSKSR